MESGVLKARCFRIGPVLGGCVTAAVFLLVIIVPHCWSQGMGDRGGMMGPGMMGGYVNVPEKLPPPKSGEWVKRLGDVLGLEKFSKRQYTHDSSKYHAGMPYMMVEPQEDDHIRLITSLFNAYGIKENDVAIPPVKDSATLAQAYTIATDLEADLMPRYEWLIKNSGDETTTEVLERILFQTRMHYNMFRRALNMVNGWAD